MLHSRTTWLGTVQVVQALLGHVMSGRGRDCCVAGTYYDLSPWIVATHFRLCFPLRNSKNQIPCQVPVASFPFVMGMLTDDPIRADFIWAFRVSCQLKDTYTRCNRGSSRTGMSSLPSASCRYPSLVLLGPALGIAFSGTRPSRASDIYSSALARSFHIQDNNI